MLRRFFEKKGESDEDSAQGYTGVKIPRHSGGWASLRKRLKAEAGLRIIDAGMTSPNNINYLTNLGHSIFLSDPVYEATNGNWKTGEDEDGKPIWNVEGYLKQTLDFAGRNFDVVLLWTTLDYLPEPLVSPLVDHLYEAMNPGGQVLSFFHTRQKGDETAYCRFHVKDADDVDMQAAQPFILQRAFTNRSIEKLFSKFSGFRQFLAKDSLSEVIITR